LLPGEKAAAELGNNVVQIEISMAAMVEQEYCLLLVQGLGVFQFDHLDPEEIAH